MSHGASLRWCLETVLSRVKVSPALRVKMQSCVQSSPREAFVNDSVSIVEYACDNNRAPPTNRTETMVLLSLMTHPKHCPLLGFLVKS
jgi:hypothetical protein